MKGYTLSASDIENIPPKTKEDLLRYGFRILDKRVKLDKERDEGLYLWSRIMEGIDI